MSWLRRRRYLRSARFAAAVLVAAAAVSWVALAQFEPSLQLCMHDAKGTVTGCAPPAPKQLWWVLVVEVLLFVPELDWRGVELSLFGVRLKGDARADVAEAAPRPNVPAPVSATDHVVDLYAAAANGALLDVGAVDRVRAVYGDELRAAPSETVDGLRDLDRARREAATRLPAS
jgi:hypothetical protein